MFIAHKKEGGIQTLKEHLENVAIYSSNNLEAVGLKNTGYLIGLLHDMGKYTDSFQKYISNGGTKGSVIHTFQGCRYVLDNFHTESIGYDDITAELLAVAIASHHGSFDIFGEGEVSGFKHRRSAQDCYDEAVRNFENEIPLNKISEIFNNANAELMEVYSKIDEIRNTDEELLFYFSLLSRLLSSALIDGDRRDTAEYMTGIKYGGVSEFVWVEKLAYMESKLDEFDNSSAINKARREISDICRKMSDTNGNVFRLNVPTGGSKTLSSLRFALARCSKLHKKRIIFTAPLISILDQNSKVIHEFIGDDDVILDHYANGIQENSVSEALNEKELLAEDWNSPIIITSLVQLLDTLFLGKTTSIRRFQALCNSVVVIDEVQTVPSNMLSLFNLAVNFLSTVCGTTFVLCSATQPCFESDRTKHPMNSNIVDIVKYDERIWNVFKRTEIIPKGNMNTEGIAQFALDVLEKKDSLLIICNKKKEAIDVYELLKDKDIKTFHLSSSNCMAHRRDTLDEVRKCLDKKEKTVLVSTQVIEAGVDISFESVIRLQAGMDNVIQAAGRCNRNGELKDISDVYIVNMSGENLSHLSDIKSSKDATQKLLYEHSHGTLVDTELASDQAIKYYYQVLYGNMSEGHGDFPVKEKRTSIFELLSTNEKYALEAEDRDKYFLKQAFATAGSYFKVFDNITEDVIVPYGKGRDLIADLCALDEHNVTEMKQWLKNAKPYMVSLYDYQIKSLERSGLLYQKNGLLILKEGGYGETGVTDKKQENELWEV